MAQMDFRIQGNRSYQTKEQLEWVVFEAPGETTLLLPGHSLGLFTVHVSFLMVFKMVLQGRCYSF
jgi:hypothetical protein